MKKLFYIGALTALLLAGCGGEKEAAPKEETPASEQSGDKEKTVSAETKENPVEDVIKSVTKDDFEITQNEGIVSIIIKDEKAHEGSKRAMLKDSAEIFAGLSRTDEVTSATIKWQAPLTDQYGNKKMDEVLAIMIDGETFKKVNWDNYKSLDLEAIAPGFKQHESLKD
ncbi:hypothetical protein ABE61_04315 [Lysinibacillus sphaericus]|uniref:hypothetical protein n=1 Tax=Lysinibacillus sphaericus TaxID=1421 RepID=UPI0018CEFAE8|nr:hypothetical protein [Lysinibacillus sphaericus]MBG9453319.1 hypothetical protein [Lysinibacillus sphaericus]MBG9477077.1 hypothetical protein [Lysinibacillus sphaericus]MBG9591159.1 hypothetical protein [Lysinibacillus sphaericus]MBG9592023.1 hypothetical protein [Lysinibacillus sphaericus]